MTRTVSPGRYSKVYRRKWVDEKVKALGAPPPHPFTLLDRFMTGTELTNVPGLFPAWEGGLANALKWTLEGFREAFAKVSEQGFVEADWEAGLVWMRNAIKYNEPESPNVVEGWGATLRELPDCPLKEKALAHFRAYFEAKGPKKEPWVKAFEKACGKASGKPSTKGYSPPSGNQEQEQEQDLAKAAAASQRPDRLSREPERQQLRRESDPKPIPQPAQPAPQPPSGPRPPASGALRSIPTPERQSEPLADISQNCHSNDSAEQPRPPTRRERATSDLASLPIAELARRCRENPHDAGFAAPQDRPEVRQVHEAWCRSVGLAVRKLGHLSDRNRPLWAILEALETNSLADVLRACEQASRDPWCRGEKPGRNGDPGRKRGVEELTPVVLRRLLDAADERKPEIRSTRVQKAMDAVDAVLAGQR